MVKLISSRSRQAAAYPLLCVLPQDTDIVRVVALAAAMDAAFTCAAHRCMCMRRHFPNHLDISGQLFLAFDFTRTYLAVEFDGKRGTNDEERFGAIFQEIVPRAYSGFLAFLQRSPSAAAALQPLSKNERLAALNAAARAQLHLLDLPSDEPLPLTWPAPESEVH